MLCFISKREKGLIVWETLSIFIIDLNICNYFICKTLCRIFETKNTKARLYKNEIYPNYEPERMAIEEYNIFKSRNVFLIEPEFDKAKLYGYSHGKIWLQFQHPFNVHLFWNLACIFLIFYTFITIIGNSANKYDTAKIIDQVLAYENFKFRNQLKTIDFVLFLIQ